MLQTRSAQPELQKWEAASDSEHGAATSRPTPYPDSRVHAFRATALHQNASAERTHHAPASQRSLNPSPSPIQTPTASSAAPPPPATALSPSPAAVAAAVIAPPAAASASESALVVLLVLLDNVDNVVRYAEVLDL
ncbi:hypothetical protein VDGD_21141 [Verticillium dahliae]|nr:hypothetical protein VDGD_21141 [Verticillium dahliae]